MSRYRIVITALSLILWVVYVPTYATLVLTFDELPPADKTGTPIPNGYGGFDWSNFYYHPNNYEGYKNGCVSAPHVAFNSYAEPAMMSDSSFDFMGAYFTGAWTNVNIKVEGYSGVNLIYSKTVVASYDQPTWYTFDFMGVDQLRFSSLPAGNSNHFVMDDFTFVPEPATVLLLGLGGLALLRKRRTL